MTNKIQLFQSLRESCKVIGMHPLQLNHGSYNLRNSIVLLFLMLSSVSSGAFFVWKSDNIQDFSASFYTFITESVSVVCFLAFRNQMTRIFNLMDELEAFIMKSELKLFFLLHFCRPYLSCREFFFSLNEPNPKLHNRI